MFTRASSSIQLTPRPIKPPTIKRMAQLANARAVLLSTKLKAARYADMVKINAVSQQDADDATGRRRRGRRLRQRRSRRQWKAPASISPTPV